MNDYSNMMYQTGFIWKTFSVEVTMHTIMRRTEEYQYVYTQANIDQSLDGCHIEECNYSVQAKFAWLYVRSTRDSYPKVIRIYSKCNVNGRMVMIK